jgi:hypothetical protein
MSVRPLKRSEAQQPITYIITTICEGLAAAANASHSWRSQLSLLAQSTVTPGADFVTARAPQPSAPHARAEQ